MKAVLAYLIGIFIGGALLGGIWMIKLGLRSRHVAVRDRAGAHQSRLPAAVALGKNYVVMVGAVALDALASGMGNIAVGGAHDGAVRQALQRLPVRAALDDGAAAALHARLPAGYDRRSCECWGAYYWTSFALARCPGSLLVWIMREPHRVGTG